MIQALDKDLTEFGYETSITEDGLGVSSFKADVIELKNTENINTIDYNENDYIKNYSLINSGENILGDFLIKTEIYKRK